MLVAGIDQGTTSTKGLLLDGSDLAPLASLRHDQSFPQPGRVEHDPEQLLVNVRALVDEAAARGARVVGLANQGETVVAWNRETGKPLAPAIVWQDQRTAGVIEDMVKRGKAEEVAAIAGLRLDSYFSASKLRWLLDNVEGARALASRGQLGLGTSDGYFVERLTGRYATDPTTASRTSLMNLSTCQWDARLCDLFGVPIEILPEIADDRQPIGEIDTPHGPTALMSSMVDQVAALYGHGCRAAGEGKITVGSGAFALIVTGQGRPGNLPAGSVPTAAWAATGSRTYAADGGVYTAASAVEWLKRLGVVDRSEGLEPTGSSAAERGLMFVPALAGLAFPHWDRSAAGLFIGLDSATDREDLLKAVLEGVAFRVAELLEGLGFARDAIVPIDGGLARSHYFTAFLAGIARRRLRVCEDVEATSLGAAQLAAAVARGQDPAASPVFAFADQPSIEPRMSTDAAESYRDRFAEAVGRSRRWRS